MIIISVVLFYIVLYFSAISSNCNNEINEDYNKNYIDGILSMSHDVHVRASYNTTHEPCTLGQCDYGSYYNQELNYNDNYYYNLYPNYRAQDHNNNQDYYNQYSDIHNSRRNYYTTDDFRTIRSSKSQRTYWKIVHRKREEYMRVEFTIPEYKKSQFIYIQFWLHENNCETTEFGLMKSEGQSQFRPMLFNTDDCYKTGYFGRKKTQWSSGGSTTRRTNKYNSYKKYGHRYESGDRVRIVAKLDEDSNLEIWINKDYIGSIKVDHNWFITDFGSETAYDEEPIILQDVQLDY